MSEPITVTREMREQAMREPTKIAPEIMAVMEANFAKAAGEAPLYWRKMIPPEDVATETPENLREVVLALTQYADITRMRNAALVKMIRQLIGSGKACDDSRQKFFENIEVHARGLAFVASVLGGSATTLETSENPNDMLRLRRDVAARKRHKKFRGLDAAKIDAILGYLNIACVGASEVVAAGCEPLPWPDPASIEMPDGWTEDHGH